MNMLQHFENFQITDTIYDTNNPWTIAEANSQSDYATHLFVLKQILIMARFAL